MKRVALLALLLLHAATARAADPPCTTTASCLEIIQRRQGDTHSFTADFVQVKHVSLLDEPLTSRGRLSFRRPDRVRLEITEPLQALVLINGREVKIPGISAKDAEAMSMAPVAGMFTQLGALFSGDTAALQKSFEASATARDGGIDVALVPRDESARRLFRRIDLRFSGADMMARQIRLEDGLGDHLDLSLENVQRNVELPDTLFETAAGGARRSAAHGGAEHRPGNASRCRAPRSGALHREPQLPPRGGSPRSEPQPPHSGGPWTHC